MPEAVGLSEQDADGDSWQAVPTSSGLELQLSELTEADLRELFDLFSLVVAEEGAFPHDPPAARSDFERAWIERKTAVIVARAGGALAGSYWLAESLGFEVIGRVPDAVGGEPALLYWRAL
jgi:hypothetical protein